MAAATNCLAPSMQTYVCVVGVGLVVANGALGGVYEYVPVPDAAAFWQVSMILNPALAFPPLAATPEPSGTLAAAQQRSFSQTAPGLVASSSLFGLKVPLERAFSHLEFSFPKAGLSAWFFSRRALIFTRLSFLSVSYFLRVAA